jgi:phospholipid/cholesterol/gamma-HCH transport system substrate-binding protein
MRGKLSAAVWRFVAFAVVCVMGIFALFAIFSQLRFQSENVYEAEFTNVSGLKVNDFVRIAGVEVGKVKDIELEPNAGIRVAFSADQSVVLTGGSRAVIRYENLIGDRFLELQEGAGGPKILHAGDVIPLERTAPALDLDALVGGFRPLFRALDPDQVNQLSRALVDTFQGQGSTIESLLAQTASATNTLADRDQLIGEVIGNLKVVLASLGDQSEKFDTAVTSLSDLVGRLAANRDDLTSSVANTNDASASIADLLSQARPPLQETIAQTDRTSANVLADAPWFDNLLKTLPEKYKVLGRQGLYGDFFAFYLCDAILKVNGKGGQPVFIKVAGQDTGRCAPR